MGWGNFFSSGGSDIISSTINAAAGLYSSHQSAKYAQSMQKQQLAWERERAKNAHQWEVEDLIKAGLNPILSAGGTGANTGGISAPMPDTSGITSAGQAISQGLNSFRDYIVNQQNANSNTKIAESQSQLNQANAAKTALETKMYPEKTRSEIRKNSAEASVLEQDNRLQQATFEADVNKHINDSIKSAAEGYISQDNAQFLENYGITKEQAINLGETGLKIIGDLIARKISVSQIKNAADEILKNKKNNKTLKRNSKGQFYWE